MRLFVRDVAGTTHCVEPAATESVASLKVHNVEPEGFLGFGVWGLGFRVLEKYLLEVLTAFNEERAFVGHMQL